MSVNGQRAKYGVSAGDAMVREIDVSRITLRLVAKVDRKGEGKDEHVLAKLSGNTLEILKRHLVSQMISSLTL